MVEAFGYETANGNRYALDSTALHLHSTLRSQRSQKWAIHPWRAGLGTEAGNEACDLTAPDRPLVIGS
jgi:hypothetical protein